MMTEANLGWPIHLTTFKKIESQKHNIIHNIKCEKPSSGTDATPSVLVSILQQQLQTQEEHSRGKAKDHIIPL